MGAFYRLNLFKLSRALWILNASYIKVKNNKINNVVEEACKYIDNIVL